MEELCSYPSKQLLSNLGFVMIKSCKDWQARPDGHNGNPLEWSGRVGGAAPSIERRFLEAQRHQKLHSPPPPEVEGGTGRITSPRGEYFQEGKARAPPSPEVSGDAWRQGDQERYTQVPDLRQSPIFKQGACVRSPRHLGGGGGGIEDKFRRILTPCAREVQFKM